MKKIQSRSKSFHALINSQKSIWLGKEKLVKVSIKSSKNTQNLPKTDVIDHLRGKENSFHYTLVQPDKT